MSSHTKISTQTTRMVTSATVGGKP
jgi:hypothetical protein